jgi:DNA/RNA-binding domain of Phe-tRNA-synthetase-like protein
MSINDKKGKQRPLVSGLATEETLQAVLAASGGSTFTYIQSDEGATYKYYGYTDGTNWKIKRKTLATGVWMVATGVGDYDTAFADRAAKSYSYTV